MHVDKPVEKEIATGSSILAGKSHGQRTLVGYSPWRHKESNRNESDVFRQQKGNQFDWSGEFWSLEEDEKKVSD